MRVANLKIIFSNILWRPYEKVLCSSLLFLGSCKETDDAIIQSDVMPKISNNSNPYEIVGDLHSQGLEFIKNNYLDEINPNIVQDSATLYNNLTQATAEFVKNITDSLYPGNTITITEISNSLQSTEPVVSISIEQKLDLLLNDPNLTTTEKNYIQKIFNAINPDTFEEEEFNNTVNIFCNRIIEIETDILANVSNETEKMHLLSFTAVLRDSYSYWFVEFNNPNSLWFALNIGNPPGLTKNIEKTLGLSKREKALGTALVLNALEDAGGAIAGAAVGGVVFGPGGMVMGATGGAIRATLKSLIVTAVVNKIFDLF